MGVGLTVVLVVFVICVTILAAMYVYYCNENGIGMFQNPKYEERIEALEKEIKKMRKEK